MVKLHSQACNSLLVQLKSCFSSLWTALQDGREGCLVRASWPHPPRQRRDSRDISHACLSMSVSPQVSELTEGWRVTFISFTLSKKYGVWKCVKTQKTFVIWMTPGPKKKKPVSQILPASGIRTPRPTHTPADAGSHFHERALLQTHGETGPLRDPRPSSLPSPRSPSVSSSLLLHMTFTTV